MIRTTSLLAILAVAATTPAFATTPASDAAKSFTAELTRAANDQQAREFLAKRGYIATSELRRGSDGELIGSALKNGVPVTIVHKMPPRILTEPMTN